MSYDLLLEIPTKQSVKELHIYANKERQRRLKGETLRQGCPRLSYGAVLLNFLLGRTSYYYLGLSQLFSHPSLPKFAAFTK